MNWIEDEPEVASYHSSIEPSDEETIYAEPVLTGPEARREVRLALIESVMTEVPA